MTMIATNISENANETMKKFCTVLKGRKVKTERITRILPQMHKTTILERTNATGMAFTNGMARIDEDGLGIDGKPVELIGLRKFADDGEKIDIFDSLAEIKYQSRLLKLNGR